MHFFLVNSVLIGPFRLLLVIFGLFLIHQFVTGRFLGKIRVDLLMKSGMWYSSILLLILIVLVLLDMYDLFSLLLIFIVFIILKYLEIAGFINWSKSVKEKKRKFLLGFFSFMENRPNFRSLKQRMLKGVNAERKNSVLFLFLILGSITFTSRFLFFKYDLYTLSSLWLKQLGIVKSFENGGWFNVDLKVKGELLFIDFYSKITGVSQEMALVSFGMLEDFFMSIVLFWVILKTTRSIYIAPICGVLFFAFFYQYLPININLLQKHSAIYLSLIIGLPAMVFIIYPEDLQVTKRRFLEIMLTVFVAIGFIDFFVLLCVFPFFFIAAILFTVRSNRSWLTRGLLAYIIAVTAVLFITYLSCYFTKQSFENFLLNNLVQIDSYTHFPQLGYSLSGLLTIYSIIGGLSLIITLFLWFKDSKRWAPLLIMSVFCNGFMVLQYFPLNWIDIDLFYKVLSILVVLIFGMLVGLGVLLFKYIWPKAIKWRIFFFCCLFIAIISTAYFSSNVMDYNIKEREPLKSEILEVYSKLSMDNLPFSYAVVNQQYGQLISEKRHHYMHYTEFLNSYPQRDSIFWSLTDETRLLEENEQFILPQTVYVFVAEQDSSISEYGLVTPKNTKLSILQSLEKLRRNGRQLTLYYQNSHLTVYKIVNEENATSLDDLIF